MPNTSILPDIPSESYDTPKKFLNIDNEVFDFTWENRTYQVKPGEIVLLPKYLVNYAAMHLARKMYKRKCFAEFKGTELEKANANIRHVNAEEEKKLQEQMVAINFPQTVPAPAVIEKREEVRVEETLKCDKCEFVARTKAGLSSHRRSTHK